MEDHEGIVVNLLDITFHKKREMPLQPLCGVRFRKKYSRRERIMKKKDLTNLNDTNMDFIYEFFLKKIQHRKINKENLLYISRDLIC